MAHHFKKKKIKRKGNHCFPCWHASGFKDFLFNFLIGVSNLNLPVRVLYTYS